MAYLLLLFIPAGLAVAFGLTGRGIAVLARRRSGRPVWHRGLAALLGAVAAALYTWGLLHLAGTVLEAEGGGADSSPIRPCRVPGQTERAASVVGYRVDYLPLRFVCETKGGGEYAPASAVPGYIGPAALGFALAAAVCAGAGAAGSRRADSASVSP